MRGLRRAHDPLDGGDGDVIDGRDFAYAGEHVWAFCAVCHLQELAKIDPFLYTDVAQPKRLKKGLGTMKNARLIWRNNRKRQAIKKIFTSVILVLAFAGCAKSGSDNPLKLPSDCLKKLCAISALEKTGILFKLGADLPEGSINSSVRDFWDIQENDHSLLWRQAEDICGDMEQDILPKNLTEKQTDNILLGCHAENLL